jgi:hypothetical protein
MLHSEASISYVQQIVHDPGPAKFPMHCVEFAPVQGSRHPTCASVNFEMIIEMKRLRRPRIRTINFIVAAGKL